MIRERAAEVESDRGIFNEVIAAIREREIFCVLQPRMFGGFEHDWEVMIAVSFEIAAACGPTVWVTSLGIGHQWFVSKFPIEAQHDIWDDNPDAITFGSYAPSSNTKAFTKPGFATEAKDQGLAIVLSGAHLPGQTNSSGFTIPNDESDCGCIRQNPVPCSRSYLSPTVSTSSTSQIARVKRVQRALNSKPSHEGMRELDPSMEAKRATPKWPRRLLILQGWQDHHLTNFEREFHPFINYIDYWQLTIDYRY